MSTDGDFLFTFKRTSDFIKFVLKDFGTDSNREGLLKTAFYCQYNRMRNLRSATASAFNNQFLQAENPFLECEIHVAETLRTHFILHDRWSLIAGRLPGRTDNEIKNYWNTVLRRKVHGVHVIPKRKPRKRTDVKKSISNSVPRRRTTVVPTLTVSQNSNSSPDLPALISSESTHAVVTKQDSSTGLICEIMQNTASEEYSKIVAGRFDPSRVNGSTVYVAIYLCRPASINDLPERPSPISVLEPFFDDVNSPTASTPYAELQIKQLHFEDEEDNCATMVITSSDLLKHPEQCIEDYMPLLEFVTAVLQASGMKWGELWDKNSFSGLLLGPSLFDEVEYVEVQDCGDSKLLFDCTNEVLTELYKRYNGSSPWVAFVNPDIRPAPKGNNIIQEVWEGNKWNLPPPLMPHTLDQIIGKDMEKCRTWMDLRPDVEAIGNEMVDVILEEIVEGNLFDLCS